MGLVGKLKFILLAVILVPIALYLFSAYRFANRCMVERGSCLEHRKAGCSLDGEYNLKIQNVSTVATCDMKADGGGWTLIGNYLHRASSEDDSKPRVLPNMVFPIEGQILLGVDERMTKHWGHISRETINAVPFKEIRFRCQTSAHPRILDFALTGGLCLNYFKTGQGTCAGTPVAQAELAKTWRGLLNNKSRLPMLANKGWNDQREFALTNYPFFLDFKHHWSIGAAGNRFECDDYEFGGRTNTHHQIFVR